MTTASEELSLIEQTLTEMKHTFNTYVKQVQFMEERMEKLRECIGANRINPQAPQYNPGGYPPTQSYTPPPVYPQPHHGYPQQGSPVPGYGYPPPHHGYPMNTGYGTGIPGYNRPNGYGYNMKQPAI
jgi:hypothetical protein